jgi:hypothetical protein
MLWTLHLHDKSIQVFSPYVQYKNSAESVVISLHCKKENKLFLIYEEIQNGAVAKSYMTNGLLING